MIATGIVRRIDELGRVVIPKEVRRAMGIKDGDSLEIFRDKDHIVLQKYSCADEVGQAVDFLKSWIDDPESDAAENMTSLELDIFKSLLEMVYKKHNGEENE
jgi:stage V sporulation protein T